MNSEMGFSSKLRGLTRLLMGTLSEYLGLRLALALGAMVSGSFWLATRFRHKCMAAGMECPPAGATEGRP
jgi:hypothetical protein